MAHPEQIEFCQSVKEKIPSYFRNISVLDVGSLDINGNNRFLFKNCDYIGLDINSGKNVNTICPVHKYNPGFQFDTIISTEMLEHDKYWKKSLKQMVTLLKNNGLLIITAAANGRKEHGTYNNHPKSSPYTNNYYRNITSEMISEGLNPDRFIKFELDIINTDIFFWGIKS